MTLTRKVDGVEVPLSAAEETAVRAEWAANDAKRAAEVAALKPLPAWAFKRVLEKNNLLSLIQTRIEALPDSAAKDRALGKFKHGTTFTPDAPEMVQMRALMEANIPGFDFEALWRQGEALL